jgi:hypothetical protein
MIRAGPFLCTCKIDNAWIIFCPTHAAAESLFNALTYARAVIAEIPFAKPGHEALKKEVVVPTLDRALAKRQKSD